MLQRIKCVCCMLILLCIAGINLSHAKIDIDDDGTVKVAAVDSTAMHAAIEWIESLRRGGVLNNSSENFPKVHWRVTRRKSPRHSRKAVFDVLLVAGTRFGADLIVGTGHF